MAQAIINGIDGMMEKFTIEQVSLHSSENDAWLIINNNVYNIRSLDTSNPVVAGLLGYQYNGDFGLNHKPSQLLADLIHADPNDDAKEVIRYNTSQFKKIIKR